MAIKADDYRRFLLKEIDKQAAEVDERLKQEKDPLKRAHLEGERKAYNSFSFGLMKPVKEVINNAS